LTDTVLVEQVATVLNTGRVADWEQLCADVPADALRAAVVAASVPESLCRLALHLLDGTG
jgi:hypothetical protein